MRMQLIVGILKIAFVIDPLLDDGVLGLGVVKGLHKAQLLEFAMQIQHSGAAVTIQVLADQGRI